MALAAFVWDPPIPTGHCGGFSIKPLKGINKLKGTELRGRLHRYIDLF